MQCPNCGRETADLIDGFCAACASERLDLVQVPEVLDATECAHCRRIFMGNSWRQSTDDRTLRVSEFVRAQVSCDPRLQEVRWSFAPRWEDDKNATTSVRFTARLAEAPVNRAAETRVRFKTGVCGDCSREMGGYFEATLQVRGSEGTDLEHLLPRIEDHLVRRMDQFRDEGRPNAFFTEVNRFKHGIDFVMGSHEAAKILSNELADRYGAETDESTKLYGRKDGRDVYRWTNLIRLPPYAKGDFLLIEGVPCKLLSFDRRNLALLDLHRHVRIRREIRRVGPIRVIGRSHEEKPAIVVSRSATQVQVMDPVSYKTVDIPREGIEPGAETVPVFRHEETLYVVRDSGN